MATRNGETRPPLNGEPEERPAGLPSRGEIGRLVEEALDIVAAQRRSEFRVIKGGRA